MTVPIDPHDGPHQVIDRLPLPVTVGLVGCTLLVEVNPSAHHLQYVLTQGEGGPREIIECIASGEPIPEGGWGTPPSTVLDIVSHLVVHLGTRTPPDPACSL